MADGNDDGNEPVVVGTTDVSAVRRSAVESLLRSLRTEKRLLGEFVDILRKQRASVAVEDLEKVEATVRSAHRILTTQNEARTHRRDVVGILVGDPNHPLGGLVEALGLPPDGELGTVVSELQSLARVVKGELAVSRRVLGEAVRRGRKELGAIFGEATGEVVYGPGSGRADDGPIPPGRILNQRV